MSIFKPSLSLTLRAKFLILLTLVFVFFIGLLIVSEILNFETSKEEKQATFLWSARWIESEQQRHIAQVSQTILLVKNHLHKGLPESICYNGIVGKSGLDPEIGQYAIVNPDGKVSCNSIPWLTIGNVADQRYFKEALKRVGFGFIDETNERNLSQYSDIMARSMRDKDGHVQKVILAAMDFTWIQEEIDLMGLPETGHIFIVDENGLVVADSKNVADRVGESIADTPFYKQTLASKSSIFDGPGITGKNSIIVSRSFTTESGDMRVIIDVPHDVLLQPACRNLAIRLAFITVMFLLILVFSYFWSNKYFLHKILLIEAAANKFTGGDLSARVNMSGKDEISHLAQFLDAAADSLQVNSDKLLEANNELYRVNRSLRVLSAGNRSLLFSKTESELVDKVCREIVENCGYLGAWIGFSEQLQDQYFCLMSSHFKAEDEPSKLDWSKVGNTLKPAIATLREDRVLVINDTGHESVYQQVSEHAAKLDYRSIIILPLRLEDKPIGVLIICAYRINEFSNDQIKYLKEAAQDISFGIEMMRTRGEKNRLAFLGVHHELTLRNSLEDAIRAIALTIEMRDPYTAGHQRRVGDLAKALARELGLSDDEIHGIYLASIVHDIGKINVPAEILVKPSKLNEMEYALVKQHVTSSYEILKGIKFPWPIADMVHQHHERIDGTGYPLGLKNGEISFGGRILAVADVVEAMTSHRPYRPGLGIQAALKEIERGKATFYDSAVVDACLKLFHEERFKFEGF